MIARIVDDVICAIEKKQWSWKFKKKKYRIWFTMASVGFGTRGFVVRQIGCCRGGIGSRTEEVAVQHLQTFCFLCSWNTHSFATTVTVNRFELEFQIVFQKVFQIPLLSILIVFMRLCWILYYFIPCEVMKKVIFLFSLVHKSSLLGEEFPKFL